MAHARALLTGSPEDQIRYVEEDLRRPDKILEATHGILDLTEPVGLVLVAVAHFLADQDEAVRCVRTLVDALPRGSHLVMTLATTDFLNPELKAGWDENLRTGRSDVHPRDHDQAAAFFAGLDLVEPGLVAVPDWRPADEGEEHPAPVDASLYGGVALIP